MRVSNLLRMLAIACAAITVALVGAQSADAALSWTGGQEREAAHRCGGPCYVVNVEVHGVGRVTSVIPAAVPGATGFDQYPNGHVECPASGVWTCSFYFNWPFDQTGQNPNNEVVVFQATGGTFLGWTSCPDGHATGNQCRLDAKEGSAGLVDCVVAQFAVNPDTVVGSCDTEAPPPPQALRVHVVKAGTGSGKVTSFPSKIDCGTICQKYFQNGDVSLTATPAAGSVFAGWVIKETTQVSTPTVCQTTTKTCTWTLTGVYEYRATATFNLSTPALLNTVLLSKPPKSTKGKTAIFYWGAKNKSNKFVKTYKSQCKLDKAKSWTTCKPGKTYKKLKPGTHTFHVRVGNADGWDKTPVSYSWKVKK